MEERGNISEATGSESNDPCDFCGSRDIGFSFIRADGKLVVECSCCGLAWLNSRPSDMEMSVTYGKEYFDGTMQSEGIGGLKLQTFETITSNTLRDMPRVARMLQEKCGSIAGKKILEIGCSDGVLLLVLKRMGALVEGVELSSYAAEMARKKGLLVHNCTADQYAAQAKSDFDIIVACEVIEHMPSPKIFLKSVSNMIKPNGIFVCTTPNYHGAHRHGNQWSGFNYSFEHVYFFSVEVLRRLSARFGFSLEYWETTVDPCGPPYKYDFIKRQINRIGVLATIICDRGLIHGVEALLKRQFRYIPFGSGRTLTVFFRRLPNTCPAI